MKGNPYLYILTMAAVTYAIRALPLTLIRKEIKSRFLRSFLYYVPYVTLSVMTFPSIISATTSPIAAALGFAAALFLAWKNKGLLAVACVACAVVFAAELVLVR